MHYCYNTGGQEAHRSLKGGYCGVRALVIAHPDLQWSEAEAWLKSYTQRGKAGNRKLCKGIYKEDYSAALADLGWVWCRAPTFTGRKARAADLADEGIVIARQAGHYTAVVDGVINDIWDCSHKMVYGFWRYEHG